MDAIELLPDFLRFESGCNVYLLRDGARAIAVDLGDGRWLAELPRLGIRHLDHVVLTHHHADQCSVPADWRGVDAARMTTVYAPAGEEAFLDPESARALCAPDAHLDIGCPSSYSVPPAGLAGVRYDMAGFTDRFWGSRRVRFLLTPGHSRAACSVLLETGGRQVLCIGDAGYAGGKIWEPWHLEWDHWTGTGALAAWEGVERLGGVAADLVCPSHGPVVRGAAAAEAMFALLARRLLALYAAKGRMTGPQPDRYVEPLRVEASFRQYSDALYQFGMNGYLLRSRSGETIAIDPTEPDLQHLETLLSDTGIARPSWCAVTHYHGDHCDGVPALRRAGARLVLHPWVAEPLADVRAMRAPWLPREDLRADETWPETGEWRWHEYSFRVAPSPGQTLWSCVFAARIDGRVVAFTGDTFQPASRWNGTGGFSAYNRSLFRGGFARSARLLLDWSPEWLAAGHGTVSRFEAARFRAVIRWSRKAERAVRDLCPTGSLSSDYYAWGTGGQRTPPSSA